MTGDHLVVVYHESSNSDATLSLEMSDDLANWQSGPELVEVESRVNNGDGSVTVSVIVVQPVVPEDQRLFVRLRAD